MGLVSKFESRASHNDTRGCPKPTLVHSLFEAQVTRSPHAVAVEFEQTSRVTYREINELSNNVARQLVCGRGSIVPILMERSINMVVSLLAILKTGAAYTLVSPESPPSRVRFIAEDTKAPFVLVDRAMQGQSGVATEIVIEDLIAQTKTADSDFAGNLYVHQSPSDIAYVIYTSGSTGRPKGVLLSHKAAVTGLKALPRPDKSEQMRILLSHSPAFSAAQRTILGTLSRGGVLCLASKESITSWLFETIKKANVSSLEITPSMLQLLDPTQLPSAITRITLGGEPAGPSLVSKWAEKVELYSGYGISECTQLNMRSRITVDEQQHLLGKPTDSTNCYILHPGTMNPVSINEPGELCLCGDQLASGYLNLPKETQKAFVPNIFGNGRLFRTGDLVSLREDGSMVLIGRVDHQFKVDGQRVDPNESNYFIESQPHVVRSCVVAATVRGRKSLVGAIVSDNKLGWADLVKNVRTAIRDELQDYAIPRYWIQMEKLPVNPNGKTDIRRLAEEIESMGDDMFLAANSKSANNKSVKLDADIREILEQVLRVPSDLLNPAATFQEMGGSSLDAIVLATKARSIGVNLAVSDILKEDSLHEVFASRRGAVQAMTMTPKPFSLLPEGVKIPGMPELEDAYPVTPMQEGILADSLLGNANYVYQRVYEIHSEIEVAQLKNALEVVVQKNQILRTSFKPWKRSFLQMVHKSVQVPWTSLGEGDLATTLEQLQSRHMELSGPLIRATTLGGRYFILEMHHSLFDYWSSQFVFVDMVSLLKTQTSIDRVPFSTYVSFQQARAKHVDTQNFWKKYLASARDTIIEYPEGKPGSQRLQITADLGESLSEYCHVNRVTLGTAVHQAWSYTLASHFSSNDVMFLTAASGRDAEAEGILSLGGPTLCTVPFRAYLEQKLDTQASSHGRELQSDLWNLANHAHVGFRDVMSTAQLKTAALNTMVNVITKMEQVEKGGPLEPLITHVDNFTQYTTIELDESNPTEIKLLIPVSADEYAARDLLDTFVFIVEKMVADPQVLVRDLISTETDAEQFGLAHSAFERWAVQEPGRLAIKTKQTELSYRELNRRAESFAHLLRKSGIRHGDFVPVFMEKSEQTLVVILGILKAGAAFVPLSSHNPRERNMFIITDVEASCIVTDKETKEECQTFGLPMILPEDAPQHPDPNLKGVPGLSPDSIAYVIFTSGSTGTPKGVLVPHSAVDAATRGMVEATAVTKDWRALWVLNYIFDASYYDVFTLLSSGAALCVAPQDDILGDLAGYINEMGVEQVMLTPTITKLIRGGPSEVPRLKVLNVCGEKIDTNILEWAKSVDVYNGYGPTEATILMTVSKVQPDGNLNSIGYPLKHVSAVILPAEGDSLEEVERGQVGELCVLGPQLAKGYLNRPEQTQKAFIRDASGAALYRTGDLAHWADDGSLLCLGRKDYQIKLNGFRIELGEIENAILHTTKVNAVVVSVAELHKKRQLVAFCIFEGDQKPSEHKPMPAEDRLENVKELMDGLQSIAHYMMPALFLPFHSFPTLASGKANRKELVKIVEEMGAEEVGAYLPTAIHATEFVPVSTENEKVMQGAWAAVLDLPEESIGAASVFLGLGGDSIAAINVVAHCRAEKYAISVGQLLAHPTLAEQAACLKPIKETTGRVDVKYEIPQSLKQAVRSTPGLDVDDIEEVYPCGPGQTEFLTQGVKPEQFWNLVACRALPYDFDLDQWKDVTRNLTAANQILRAFYFQADPNDATSWYQITLKEPVLNWEEKRYSTEEEKTKLITELRFGRFEFGKPAVNYLVLTSQIDQSRTLCIKVDHGSYDGTLLRIFDDQFKAFVNGSAAPSIYPFKHYIDWLHHEDREEHLSYWTSLLDTYQPPTARDLPLDPVSDRLKFSILDFDVDSVAERLGVTASTMFQAAYAIVAGRLLNTNDVLVDNLITGRNAGVDDPQLLNGTCANFLPFRTGLGDASTSLSTFLKDTQGQFWESTENGAVGLSDIYRGLGRDRQVHSAKLLYCFQPFEPARPGMTVNHMRWLVMAQSKVFMIVNYALMVEVQKTVNGYRLKLQWDGNAFTDGEIDGLPKMFEAVFRTMEAGGDTKLGALIAA
ncbi:hypothetical protein F5B22DRAFT_603044 [Xylaria bambusicola]|uniref:uncharacterized protein n=1 Tax=Xylaria bambusicola TaxID=326684 RepID=UPI0020083D36|nr:uncharacterized protein F5B22DRAFT_603044 [Xylaria bambusicola]KAI0517458.1 hypothetical protein F5B22DRAFT_603044 [Xylaria bambusicola]